MEPELIIKLDLSFDSSLFIYRSPLRCLLLFLSVIGPFIKKEKKKKTVISPLWRKSALMNCKRLDDCTLHLLISPKRFYCVPRKFRAKLRTSETRLPGEPVRKAQSRTRTFKDLFRWRALCNLLIF